MRDPSYHDPAWFPTRSLLGLVAGYAALCGLAQCLPYDPLASLPTDPPPAALVIPPDWQRPPADGEFRIAVVGASESIGHPYGKDVSFARLVDQGLAALAPLCRISVEPFGGTALDSPRIAAIARQALAAQPRVLVVVLGGLELAGRVFAGRELIPESAFGYAQERLSRPRLLAAGAVSRPAPAFDQDRVLAQILDKVGSARPGRPALTGLPVGGRDRAALAARLARTIDELARECAALRVRLILVTAPENPVSEPFGVVPAAVTGSLARRDADPAPIHGTSAIHQTITDRAAALGISCLRTEALELSFVDALHPSPEGYVALATAVADQLLNTGAIPPELLGPLPQDWRSRFRAAANEHVARVLPVDQRRDAELQARWGDALLHMLCGNFAGALPQVRAILVALETAPEALQEQQVRDMSRYALLCVLGLAGRIQAELPRAAAHADALRVALRSHTSSAWVDALLR